MSDRPSVILTPPGSYRMTTNRRVEVSSPPLSPLIGALYLKPLDDSMAETGLFYARFMDDWVILVRTRWQLRRAIRRVCRTMEALKVQQHPDKTFIGRTCRGFDFLGYQFSPTGLSVADSAVQRHAARRTRLYEQGALPERIGSYVRHWRRWVGAGLGRHGLSPEPVVIGCPLRGSPV